MLERWHPASPPVKAAELSALFAAHPIVVIYFWAPWNGVDRLFSPEMDVVRSEFQNRIEVRSVDVDDPDLNPLCEASKVVNVPALGCFRGGQRVGTVIGRRSMSELRVLFNDLLDGGDAVKLLNSVNSV